MTPRHKGSRTQGSDPFGRGQTPFCCAAGFSLLEVLIAMAILSIGIVGAFRVFPVGLRASQRAELHSRAVMAAQRTLESLKLQPWDALAEGSTTAQEDGFDVTTRVTQPTIAYLTGADRLKAIEVTVSAPEGGRPLRLAVVTYLRRDASAGER